MSMQPPSSDEERQRYREECERHAAELGERVNNLYWSYRLDRPGSEPSGEEGAPPLRREFWQEVREIANLFRTLRPIQKPDHDALWEHFQNAIAKMKAIEEELRGDSERQTAVMLARLQEVNIIAAQSTEREEVEGGFAVLTEVMGLMKAHRLFPPDREQLWTAYQLSQERLRQQRSTIQSRNYSRLSFRTVAHRVPGR